MNDPIADLQPILSSEDEYESNECEIRNQGCTSIQKTHSIKEYMQNKSQCRFNLKYNLTHSNIPYFHRPKITLDLDSEPAYLLGTAYESSCHEKFVAHFRTIVWMSYRTTSQSGKSDAGWGCMIRVVQMLFAESFKRQNPTANLNHIIDLFKQGERWTGSNEILLTVSSILGEYRALDKFKQSVSSKNPRKMNLDINIELYCEHITIQNFQQLKPEKEFPKLIVISSKVTEQGCNYFPEIYAAHAKHLMKMPTFCGMIGGVSSQALYIVGFQDDKVICMDPHYVQDQNEPEKVRYFKKTPRGLPFNQLCQSVSFCFHFKNIEQYKGWAAEMCHAHKVYAPYLVISMEVESPQDMIERYRKRSQDFQIL